MDIRNLIIMLIPLILRPVLDRLREETKRTPNPIDDILIQVGEYILQMFQSGQINPLIKK